MRQFTDQFGLKTLGAGITTDSETTITLDSAIPAGVDLASGPLAIEVTEDGVGTERMDITADAGSNQYTVTRGTAGSAALSGFTTSAQVYHVVTASDVREIYARTPTITVSDTEPVSPAEGDVWIDTMGA